MAVKATIMTNTNLTMTNCVIS